MERFRPSQAQYWSKCAAYQRFTRDALETTNDAAREGTCAAWVADVVLTSAEGIQCDDLIGKSHENGWMVDEQMASYVQEYVDLVRSEGGEVVAEEHVTASENPLIEGTLDSSVSSIEKRVLKIIDLKYGRRIVGTTTPQLTCYGWGKFLKLPAGSVDEIHLSIYQPRGFHKDGIYRTRILSPEKLQEEFTQLWSMAVEGQKPDSLATPGSHCHECAAAAGCEALAHTTYKMVEIIQSRNQRDMTPQELARELDFIDECKKTITARFKAIESEAEARAKKESIPGWGLKPQKGNRVFTVPAVTVQLLTGVDPYEQKLCTPAALERRGADPEKVKKLTKQPTTGHKLTRITSDDIAAMFKTKT